MPKSGCRGCHHQEDSTQHGSSLGNSSSQLAWATRHVDKNHDDDFTDSFEYYAIINIKKGIAAREQFKLFGGSEHSNFRLALTFLLCSSHLTCVPRLYYIYERVEVTSGMRPAIGLTNQSLARAALLR